MSYHLIPIFILSNVIAWTSEFPVNRESNDQGGPGLETLPLSEDHSVH